MRPSVLHLIDSFHQGGTERQAVQLTRLLHESGRYHLHVACLNGDGVLRSEIERLNLGPIEEFRLVSFHHPSTATQLRRFVSLIKSLRIDLLHAHDFYTNIFGMAGGAIARVPVRIASRRETDPGRTTAQRFIERRAFDAAHAIVVNADAIRRDLTAHGVRDGKIHTIYNGVDMRRLAAPPSMSRTDAIASFGIPVEGSTAPRLFVTILANLRLAIKDHPTFLRAAAQVHQTVPEAGFVVAGEGELVEPMRQLAAELGIADRTYFIGPCQRVPELLSFSDVCVLSSLSEGFPNVIVEYMASGHPVVSTDVGGAAEAIIEGRTGHLVKPGDALAMADRIISLLRDAERRAIFGAVGRLVALEKFSCASQLQRTDALYQRLLSGRPAVAPASRPTPHQQAAAAATDEV